MILSIENTQYILEFSPSKDSIFEVNNGSVSNLKHFEKDRASDFISNLNIIIKNPARAVELFKNALQTQKIINIAWRHYQKNI